MQRWVVTGPAGAGKSLATRFLAERGAVVVNGDAVGHALLGEPEVIAALRAEFGPGVLRDGVVDRGLLGGLVFGSRADLARLDAIMLPRLAVRMRAALDAVAAGGGARLAVLEAAVYFLMPPPGPVDLTIAVLASPATRLRRLLDAGRWSADEARRRIAAQAHLEPLWARADVQITNDGAPADLAAALTRLLAERLAF